MVGPACPSWTPVAGPVDVVVPVTGSMPPPVIVIVNWSLGFARPCGRSFFTVRVPGKLQLARSLGAAVPGGNPAGNVWMFEARMSPSLGLMVHSVALAGVKEASVDCA